MREQIWTSPGQSYIRLLPARLGITPRGYSRRMQRVLTDFGCEHSFRRAAQSVREHYGIEMSGSAVRVVTLTHARRAQAALGKQYAQPFRLLPAQGPEQLVAEADGTMICTVQSGPRGGKKPREWREMRLVAAQAQGSASTVYGATFGSVEEVGQRWGHCARDAGWSLNTHIHAVGDGAEWIRLRVQEVFGTAGKFLCDFYHVSEYLGAAAPTCGQQQPNRWRRTQQKRLRRGAAETVIESLVAYVEPEDTPDEEAPVRNAFRYLSNRTDCLNYPEALTLGLPIGSGLIESGHRHVLHARLKKAGTAWLPSHADDIAQLRVLRANLQWDSFWN